MYKTSLVYRMLTLCQAEASGTSECAVENKCKLIKLLQATELGLPSHIVCDAGKTEVARGTRTVLAIAGTLFTLLCFSINEQRG